jgi:hypothetical protein
MASKRVGLVRNFSLLLREGRIEEVMRYLAEDVVYEGNIATVQGKQAVARLLRFRSQVPLLLGSDDASETKIAWSNLEEEGDTVKVVGSCAPDAKIEVAYVFDTQDKLARIRMRGASELVAAFLRGDEPDID